MNKLITCCCIALAIVAGGIVSAAEIDVEQLNEQVNLKVDKISETGLLPTSTEIELIKGDIVFDEIINTGLTVEQAVEKYELTPTLERYITIKKVQDDLSKSNGGGREPPQP